MSLGGGECRVGRAAARYDHLRRRGAESSPPIGTNKPSRSAADDRPLPHTAPHKLLAQVEHPRRSIPHARRCPRARRPLKRAMPSEPPHRIVETGWLPLTELLKPDGCRAPPRSSHRAAGARHHQRLARASG